MKADITRKSIKALRKVIVKYGIFEYIETPLVDEELNKLENLSDFGQAYQWAFENGIVTINPESLVKKFMEVSE